MKRIFGFLPLVATLFLFSCKEAELPMEDAAIEVKPTRIETDWQQNITEVEVTANCAWTLSRSDAQGNEIDWVKVDKLSAKGSSKVGLKILQNQYQESRSAVITFEAGNATAYLDIVQEANPNKPEPEPEPEPASGYQFPMYQRFTTGQSIDIEGGKVVRYPFDQMPIEEATVEGSKITFAKGLVIEASAGSYSVARPAHTNPTKYAGFQEGFCLEG
ncbi:MAG: BACON domain-containing protein, partial [Candidatus Cryptobacteroides sp.]